VDVENRAVIRVKGLVYVHRKAGRGGPRNDPLAQQVEFGKSGQVTRGNEEITIGKRPHFDGSWEGAVPDNLTLVIHHDLINPAIVVVVRGPEDRVARFHFFRLAAT